MDIITALKDSNYNLTVENGKKWLYYNDFLWVVEEKMPLTENSEILISTESEEEAVKILLEDN
jgi:hypothetical protein